jgi:hypothetical protein
MKFTYIPWNAVTLPARVYLPIENAHLRPERPDLGGDVPRPLGSMVVADLPVPDLFPFLAHVAQGVVPLPLQLHGVGNVGDLGIVDGTTQDLVQMGEVLD